MSLNYLPFASYGVFGAENAEERAMYFALWGIPQLLFSVIYKRLIVTIDAPDVINEEDSLTVTLSFADKTGVEIIPTSARYRLDDVASDDEIIDWTDIAPTDSTLDLIIDDGDNAILNTDLEAEKKRLTMEFTYGSDSKKATKEFIYIVRNLAKIT